MKCFVLKRMDTMNVNKYTVHSPLYICIFQGEHFRDIYADFEISLTLIFIKLFMVHLSMSGISAYDEYKCSILERNTWEICKLVKRGHIQNSIYET